MAQPPGPLPISEKPLTPLAMEEADQMEKYTADEVPTVTFTAEEEKALLRRFDWILLPVMVCGDAAIIATLPKLTSNSSDSRIASVSHGRWHTMTR